jgi:pyridoxal/pyridoxine/pyridoxamine kinase
MKNKIVVKVVGVQYSNYQEAKKPFKSGMKVNLFHDAENEYDSNAVKVQCNGVYIGFLKSGSDEQQSAIDGEIDSAVLKTYNATNPTYHMFNIELTFKAKTSETMKKLC